MAADTDDYTLEVTLKVHIYPGGPLHILTLDDVAVLAHGQLNIDDRAVLRAISNVEAVAINGAPVGNLFSGEYEYGN